jgi:hypothetical protein
MKMNEIYNSWRQFTSDPDLVRLAQIKAREFFEQDIGGT